MVDIVQEPAIFVRNHERCGERVLGPPFLQRETEDGREGAEKYIFEAGEESQHDWNRCSMDSLFNSTASYLNLHDILAGYSWWYAGLKDYYSEGRGID